MKRLGFAVVALCAVDAFAAPPMDSFTLQGILRDGAGALQSGNANVLVSLWKDQNSMSTADRIQVYTAMSVPVANGLFAVTIQDVGLATSLMAQTMDVWLDLTVDGQPYPRQKVTAELFSMLASRALQADGLSAACAMANGNTGCISSGMITGVAATKITGSINAATLNSKADTAFMPSSLAAQTGAACNSGSFYTAISSGGAVTCSTAVSSLALSPISNSGLGLNASTGAVTIAVDGTILQHTLIGNCILDGVGGSGNCAGPPHACPANFTLRGVRTDGALDCISTIATANNALEVSCSNCVSDAEIENNATPSPFPAGPGIDANQHIQLGTITQRLIAPNSITISGDKLSAALQINNPIATTASVFIPSCMTGSTLHYVCSQCANGVASGGTCFGTDPPGNPINFFQVGYNGPNPVPSPSPTPAPIPNPTPAPGPTRGNQTEWCCGVNTSFICNSGTWTLTARAQCLTLGSITIP